MKGWGANMRGQYKRDKKNLIDAMQRLDSKEGLVGLDDLEWREVYPRKSKALMQIHSAEKAY
jgi:hypothetical protein